MINISKDANKNYLCKVVKLKGVTKLEGSDFLQTVTIDFNTVVTGLDAKDGLGYVYFPIESKISKEFLSSTNSFRNSELNEDKEKKGFFDDNGRVRAMKLRGERSMGYIVPLETIFEWSGLGKEYASIENLENEEFDTINNKLLVEKYVVKTKVVGNVKQGKEPKLSRLIDGQVHLHIDTENLRKNSHKVKPNDTISITYKTHGTSWWCGNVLAKRELSVIDKVSKFFGGNVQEEEYDLIYGSRKVVKNKAFGDPKGKDHFFGYDLWADIKDQVGEYIPKGWTLYGEMLGYDKNGAMIQKGFDYGCAVDNPDKPQSKIEVYRITNTTPDGLVTELSYPEIKAFCDRVGLTCAHLMFYGKAEDWLDTQEVLTVDLETKDFNEVFVEYLENAYNEKNCFMCDNKVPEEGVVIRVEDLFECKSYKLKSFNFLQWETKELDKGEIDIESAN